MGTKSPHFWWLISLMGITIIALISYIVTERVICSNRLMEYVSVCSVLLSIILSVFAIQYTYTSNNEIHQQFEKINSVANNIKETSNNLAATNNRLNENLDQIIEGLENINQSQQDISGQLQNITNPQIKTEISNLQENANAVQQGG